MTVNRYRKEESYRNHLAWVAYLNADWNRPDRHDYYLMQIAATFCGENVNKLKLKFGDESTVKTEKANMHSGLDPEAKASIEQASWGIRLGGVDPRTFRKATLINRIK
jgi:hypothetical protein